MIGETMICPKCGHMANHDSYFGAMVCRQCGWMRYDKPTNADRIRGMNDEELAGLLREVVNLGGPDYCKRLSECDALLEADVDIPDQKCYQCLIDWLRRPAEE